MLSLSLVPKSDRPVHNRKRSVELFLPNKDYLVIEVGRYDEQEVKEVELPRLVHRQDSVVRVEE